MRPAFYRDAIHCDTRRWFSEEKKIDKTTRGKVRTLVYAVANRRIVDEANSRKVLFDQGEVLGVRPIWQLGTGLREVRGENALSRRTIELRDVAHIPL